MEKHLLDTAQGAAALALNPVLESLGRERLSTLVSFLEAVEVAAGEFVLREGDTGREMYFVIAGRAELKRKQVHIAEIAPGACFGELGLVSGRPRAASVVAIVPLSLARLSRPRFDSLAAKHPALAFALLQRLVAALGQELTEMTDSVGVLLKERSLPRRTEVEVRLPDGVRFVKTGTPLREILPRDVNGEIVVAGLVDRKAVSLNTPLSSDAAVAPLTTAHWEGRRIFRRSAGLLLLETARRVRPELDVRLGPSVGIGQVVEIEDNGHTVAGSALRALAETFGEAMANLVSEDVVVRSEWWTAEEAITFLGEQRWHDSASLLRTSRSATASMVSCGTIYAPSMGPLVPSTSYLKGASLAVADGGLRLLFDDADRREFAAARDEHVAMGREHQNWLKVLAVNNVGALNDLCVSGRAAELIRVAEGFHEKNIGQIADEVRARGERVKLVCIAGPSSSGKTTFIKRLTVQLRINGINPVGISLDDYYVDREKTPRDASGEYDFEALHAIDLALLQEHLGRLVAGETVRTARYDFQTGKSHPSGGPEIALRPSDVLMLEGIHGLNPKLLGPISSGGNTFRIFIEPVTALPFDRLTRVSVSDVRLIRRIVRDRQHRGHSAADNIMRWPSVRAGERLHILPFRPLADAVFDSSLVYELAVLKVYADRYLLEVPHEHPAFTTASRLRQLIDRFITLYPDDVPSTSILREFIGGSGFKY